MFKIAMLKYMVINNGISYESILQGILLPELYNS